MNSLSLVILTLCPFAFSCFIIGKRVCLRFRTERGHCSLILYDFVFERSLCTNDVSLTLSRSPYLWNLTTIGLMRVLSLFLASLLTVCSLDLLATSA